MCSEPNSNRWRAVPSGCLGHNSELPLVLQRGVAQRGVGAGGLVPERSLYGTDEKNGLCNERVIWRLNVVESSLGDAVRALGLVCESNLRFVGGRNRTE